MRYTLPTAALLLLVLSAGGCARDEKPVQEDKAAVLNLSGDWTYSGQEGKARISQTGDKVTMELTWTPAPAPGPHYKVDATLSRRVLNGRWEALASDYKGDGGTYSAEVSADGATITVSKTEDPGAKHNWNGQVLTPSVKER